MYQFREATGRVRHLRELIRDRVIEIDMERVQSITRSYQKNNKVPPIIKIAMATYDICSEKTCDVEDFEIIVGNMGQKFLGTCLWPEWEGNWLINELREGKLWTLDEEHDLYRREDNGVRLAMSPENREIFLHIHDYWLDKTVTSNVDAWQPDGYDEFVQLGVSATNPGRPIADIPSGHLIPGFHKILTVGYGAIRKQAHEWIEAHKGNLMGEDLDKFMFYKAAEISCDAAIVMVKRYSEACARKAEACTDPKRKAELIQMADSLAWISEHPVRNFWEACQAIILYQVFLNMEARYSAPAIGRFDQWTWPYLEKDLAEGNLTMDQAQEIVDGFFLKLNCFYRASNPARAAFTGIGNTYQHTTIGGVNRDGSDACNPVTFMVLESIGRLQLHDPTVSLRIHKGTPDKLWECAIETTRLVGGLPLFQNDEVIIPGLQRELGFTLEDARDFGVIGCQEFVGCGNDYPAPNGIHGKGGLDSHGAVLLVALNNGINPMNGKSGGLQTGYLYEMETFDDVLQAFRRQFDYLNKWSVTIQNYAEAITQYHMPHPGLSISIEGCMESGKDCTAGGAKYNSYGGTATGLATVADSLTTIKYMCFDKKKCTTRELYDAVMANWEGYEKLRQQILAEVPHYGNGDPYADDIMKWVVDTYYDCCQCCYSKRAKHYKADLYGAAQHIIQGGKTWATPDGRKKGEPLADATSPAQGRDKHGPTAVMRSACCFDHSKFMDGIALNLRMHPSVLSNETSKRALRDLTQQYFDQGGMEVQYNVVSTDTMRKAQEAPEEYKDLVVRIAGYSAYFVELARTMQDDVIRRTENTL